MISYPAWMTAPPMASPSTLAPVTVTRPKSRSISTLRTPDTSASSSRTESTPCEHVIPATMYSRFSVVSVISDHIRDGGIRDQGTKPDGAVKYHPWVYTPTTHLALTSDPPV